MARRTPGGRPVGEILNEAMTLVGVGKRTLARRILGPNAEKAELEEWRRYIQRALRRDQDGQKLRQAEKASAIADELNALAEEAGVSVRVDVADLLEQPLTPAEKREREIHRLERRLARLRGESAPRPPDG